MATRHTEKNYWVQLVWPPSLFLLSTATYTQDLQCHIFIMSPVCHQSQEFSKRNCSYRGHQDCVGVFSIAKVNFKATCSRIKLYLQAQTPAVMPPVCILGSHFGRPVCNAVHNPNSNPPQKDKHSLKSRATGIRHNMTDRSVTEFADQRHLRIWSSIIFLAKRDVFRLVSEGKMLSSSD